MVLIEKTYQPNEKGEVGEQRMQIPLKTNIKFAFRAYARAHLVDYKLNVGDNRWNDFKNSLAVRDRLTHPKEVRNNVSDLALHALESKARAQLTPEQFAEVELAIETMNRSRPRII
jgi:hypothetical protein